MAPVGQASRQPARWQCLQTSDSMSQRIPKLEPFPAPWGSMEPSASGRVCSTKATWRQVLAPRCPVLS